MTQNTQTLKIEIPDGYEIDSFDKESGKITIKEKPKSVFERFRTVEDVLSYYKLSVEQFNSRHQGMTEDVAAYCFLKMLVAALNDGWVPNWDNSNKAKYYPYFDMRGSSGFRFDGCDSWNSYSYVGSRLAYKSRELAEHAAKHFTAEYRKFMTIN